MKNILITGGAGFIGSTLALRLIQQGYRVTVLDCLLPQIHGDNPEEQSELYRSISGKVHFIKGNVCNPDDWKKALEGQHIVIHLAAETGTGQSMYKISAYSEVNIGGTAHVLDFLVNHPHSVEKIIVASSRAIYGEGKYQHPSMGVVFPKQRNAEDMSRGKFEIFHSDGTPLSPLPTDEEAMLHPVSVYGITKLSQEQMIDTVCKSVGIQSVALRFQNVYGEGQSLRNPYTGILSVFSNQILQGKPINVFEDGQESRDFIHIEDAVEALMLSIEKENIGNTLLNVGTSQSTSVLTVAETLRETYQKEVDIHISGQFRLGDIRHNFADIGKIQRLLHFQPKVSFKEGIAKFARWVLTQKIEENHLEKSFREMEKRKLFF